MGVLFEIRACDEQSQYGTGTYLNHAMLRWYVDSWIAARLADLSFTAVIDIVAVAILIYQVTLLIRGTRAGHILIGIVAIGLVYNAAIWMRLEVLQSILSGLIPYTAIAVVVLFHPELRRALARVGRRRFSRGARRREAIEEILLAVTSLQEKKTGALIVIERDIGLRTFIESGVPMDALVSRDLLLAIFEKGQALHDGAVIVQKERVSAAACFLPLTMNPSVSLQLGTRHRAAIGITEESDCVSVVVSEERGDVSVAAGGAIEKCADLKRVRERLLAHFGAAPESAATEPEAAERERAGHREKVFEQ